MAASGGILSENFLRQFRDKVGMLMWKKDKNSKKSKKKLGMLMQKKMGLLMRNKNVSGAIPSNSPLLLGGSLPRGRA